MNLTDILEKIDYIDYTKHNDDEISPNTRPATMLTIADFTPTASILSSEILS